MQHIRAAIDGTGTPTWHEVLADFFSSTNEHGLTDDAEAGLVDVLSFHGRLSLDVTGDNAHQLPHSLPPEAMLQALAAQALVRWTGQKYADLIRLLAAGSESALARILRAALSQ